MNSVVYVRRICLTATLLCLLLLPVLGYAQQHARLQTQETARKGKYYSRQTATVEPQKSYWVEPGFTFTSLSLRIAPSQDFAGAYVVSQADTFWLQADEHQPTSDSLQQANLVILEKPVSRILFYPGNIRGKVVFSLINARRGNAATGKKGGIQPQNQRHQASPPGEACDKPALIEASQWQAGLPPPDYTRIATPVEHVIVHHSAGSNTSTNYTNVVRNIYLFHTLDRGWSDIGYNFLVAQDGTIFEGRSPGTQAIEPDNIQGAHFCGKNTGTMGICLLGNYNTALPTEVALASLVSLTAWKISKEELDPLLMIPHPANASLGVIAGHRDGCATECPGDNLYARLREIRQRVQQQTEACQPALAIEMYPVPSDGLLHVLAPDTVKVYNIRLYDMQGQTLVLPVTQEKNQWIVNLTMQTDGLYIVKVTGKGFQAARKVILARP